MRPDDTNELEELLDVTEKFMGAVLSIADEGHVAKIRKEFSVLRRKLKQGRVWSHHEAGGFLTDLSIVEAYLSQLVLSDKMNSLGINPEAWNPMQERIDKARAQIGSILLDKGFSNTPTDLGMFAKAQFDGITPGIYVPGFFPSQNVLKAAVLYLDEIVVFRPDATLLNVFADNNVISDFSGLLEALDYFDTENSLLMREGVVKVFTPRPRTGPSNAWSLYPMLAGLAAWQGTPDVSLCADLLRWLSVFGAVPITESIRSHEQLRSQKNAKIVAVGAELISEHFPLPVVSHEDLLEIRIRLSDELKAFRAELSDLAIGVENGDVRDVLRYRVNRATTDLKRHAETVSRYFVADLTQILSIAMIASLTQGVSGPALLAPIMAGVAISAFRTRTEWLDTWKNPYALLLRPRHSPTEQDGKLLSPS